MVVVVVVGNELLRRKEMDSYISWVNGCHVGPTVVSAEMLDLEVLSH